MHRFVCYGLGPVFTEFKRCSVLRIWPCTPRTVKAVQLIDGSKGFHGFSRPHLLQSVGGRGSDGRYSRSF